MICNRPSPETHTTDAWIHKLYYKANSLYRRFLLLSSSLTRVPVKVGLFNARVQNENDHYTHRLIHQLFFLPPARF